MELMSIGKFAKCVGVNVVTLRRMEAKGEFKPSHISSGGTRYYSTDQLKYFGKTQNAQKLVIGYCRVSTPSQKDDLENQVNYGQRSKKTKRLIEEVRKNDNSN